MIALKARVPIIPCYVTGSPYNGWVLGPLITPAKVRLVIGEPMDLSAYYGREGERESSKKPRCGSSAKWRVWRASPTSSRPWQAAITGTADTSRPCPMPCDRRPRQCGRARG